MERYVPPLLGEQNKLRDWPYVHIAPRCELQNVATLPIRHLHNEKRKKRNKPNKPTHNMLRANYLLTSNPNRNFLQQSTTQIGADQHNSNCAVVKRNKHRKNLSPIMQYGNS